MLEKVLQFTQSVLDQFLRAKFGLTDAAVVINNVINADGSLPTKNQNKIVISVLNIEQENNKQFYGRTTQLSNGSYSDSSPFDRYNLDVLFSSNFEDYNETLKFLNGTLEFFQANFTINRGSYASLPKGVNRLDYDMEQISYHQMHSLWSAMGAKYQPSIIYKMRLITIQANEVITILPEVNNVNNSVASGN